MTRPLRLLISTVVVAGHGHLLAQCDTLDFEGYPSNTDFTTQYQSCGVVFSSNGFPTPPQTYDYGIGTYTSVLHSYDWFGELRMDLVDPMNGVTPVPASYVRFTNPIDSEIDYIVAKAYDVNNNLLDSIFSTSPDEIVFNQGADLIAYILMDDAQGTAYVIDDIVISGFNTGIAQSDAASAFTLYPTLTETTLEVTAPNATEAIVVAHDGRVAMRVGLGAGQQTIDVRELAPGSYAMVIPGNATARRFVKL
jgi:hypothetical protein